VNGPRSVSVFAFLLLTPYSYVNEAQLAPSVGVLAGLSKQF
jgi:hypothetical protein